MTVRHFDELSLRFCLALIALEVRIKLCFSAKLEL